MVLSGSFGLYAQACGGITEGFQRVACSELHFLRCMLTCSGGSQSMVSRSAAQILPTGLAMQVPGP